MLKICGNSMPRSTVERNRQPNAQCTHTRNIEARSRRHFCRGNATSIVYSECVSVALVMQDAKRMRRIILSSMACLAVPLLFAAFSPSWSGFFSGAVHV